MIFETSSNLEFSEFNLLLNLGLLKAVPDSDRSPFLEIFRKGWTEIFSGHVFLPRARQNNPADKVFKQIN